MTCNAGKQAVCGLLAGRLQPGRFTERVPGGGRDACFQVPGNPKWAFLSFLETKRNSRLTLELGIETGGLSRWPGLELVPFTKTAVTVGHFL